MNDWLTVTAQCQECERVFAVSIPSTYDGSPLMCCFCGELDSYASPSITPNEHNSRQINVPRLTYIQRRPRSRKRGKRAI